MTSLSGVALWPISFDVIESFGRQPEAAGDLECHLSFDVIGRRDDEAISYPDGHCEEPSNLISPRHSRPLSVTPAKPGPAEAGNQPNLSFQQRRRIRPNLSFPGGESILICHSSEGWNPEGRGGGIATPPLSLRLAMTGSV